MRLKALLVGALLGCLASTGCQSDPSVMERVRTNKVFAMIDQGSRTDQFIMKVFNKTDSIIIRTGRGGELNGMLETLTYLDENPTKTIIIDGPCFSACTLLLSKPNNVVFTERAKFYFHSAHFRYPDGSIVLSPEGNKRMLGVFNDGTKSWINRHNAFASDKFVMMPNSVARSFYPKMFVRSSEMPDYVAGEDIALD